MDDAATLKQRLARRETWTLIAGYALAVLWPILHHWILQIDHGEDGWIYAAIHAVLSAGIIGAGTVAQITRAEQRADAVLYAAGGGEGGEGSVTPPRPREGDLPPPSIKAIVEQHSKAKAGGGSPPGAGSTSSAPGGAGSTPAPAPAPPPPQRPQPAPPPPQPQPVSRAADVAPVAAPSAVHNEFQPASEPQPAPEVDTLADSRGD